MAIPLTLGLPPKQSRGLLDGLLLDASRVVPASTLFEAESVGRVVVLLDIDPAQLPAELEAVRFDLECTAEQIDDAIALNLSAPLAVYVDGGDEIVSPAESAALLCAGGRIPGLASGRSPAEIADFLAVVAHESVGFVARAADTAEVIALLCGTMAALRGDDARAAILDPKPEKLAGLIPEAATALREVLLTIEVADPESVENALRAAGLS
ncbi:hypothetical protein [Rhodococcus sp. ARC_M6]|uniref:hypothetical protein n=1 Tax=Rhodococcus sp. ARC_M6 TaxID=2928852 RepID=UPI001FB4E08E|nr:hypothetical protein [Rhodococcus sp. ARC_M6]MCJ0906956.1 hypothetical protein [Rhodococcus sp. ARC_M6]